MSEEKKRLQEQNERYLRALELSEEKDDLPGIATEEYHGPSEAVTALVRGGILATVGYFGARMFGNAVFRGGQAGSGSDFTRKALRFSGAGILGIMGLHSGSKQVRESRSQMRRMQNTITKMYKKNEALKEELKGQLRGHGRLDASDIDALEEAQADSEQEAVIEDAVRDVQIPLPEEAKAADKTQEEIDANDVADLNEQMAETITTQAPEKDVSDQRELAEEITDQAPETAVEMQGMQHEVLNANEQHLGV